MNVGLFVTCLVDLMRPSVGFAAIELLEAAGCRVTVPETQTCCGQPALSGGDRATAVALAKKLIGEFESFDYVVAPSGSCAAQLRCELPALLADEAAWVARAAALAARSYELTDFLVSVLRLEAAPGRVEGKVTYHDSCSGLRKLGIKRQPRALLGRLPGVELVEMAEAEECCGFGGAFAVQYGEVSAAIAGRKCEALLATGATTLAGGDLGCLLNIEGRLRRLGETGVRVVHVAELLVGRE